MNSPQPPLPPQQYEIEEVRLSDYLIVLLRRKRIFLLAFLVIFLGVAVHTYTTQPIYEASAILYVKGEKPGIPTVMLPSAFATLVRSGPVNSIV